jgi:general secretion pathway protein D
LTAATFNGFCECIQCLDRRSVHFRFVGALSAFIRVGVGCALPLLALAGCAPAYLEQRTDEPQNAADTVRAADLTPRFPTAALQSSGGNVRSGGFLSFGSGAATVASNATAEASSDTPLETADGYTLNFDNSPVANVAKAVLGDILSLRYTIDPRAQGAINLSSTRPIAKKDILFVFESALHADNLGMVKEAGGYRIVPIGEGGVFGQTDTAVSASDVHAGYGLSVIPLRYVSGPTIVHLLEGFASRQGAVRASASGKMILVVGTGQERRAMVDTVRQFDVDWLRGQSVGFFPVKNSSSNAIASELEKIMDTGEAGLGHGLVKVQEIPQQNAILVVAARPGLLKAAVRWIERLDSPNLSAAGLHVYKVRYGDATQLAHLLTSMFGGAGGANTDATAPGSGSKQLTVTDRLTGGGSSTQNGVANAQNGAPSAGAAGANPSGSAQQFGGLQTAALNSAFAAAGSQEETSVLPNVRITADAADNSVLVYASAGSYRIIERALQQIDRPRAQVAIDVTIAEVTLNDQLNYGVQFFLSSHLGSIVNSNTGLPPTSQDAPSGFNVFVGNTASPHAIINALNQLTDVRILSNPSLVVVDNQQATLEVGDQVPVATGSATVLSANNAVVNTVDYKNTGIILDVLPRISPDNTVQLEINQEISDVVNPTASSNASATSQNLTPTISERKVKSEISVASGQMVLLAGLISETQSKSRSGVPVLDQLPLVGGAFGTTGKQRQRTELIILIKPQIIHNSVDASRVAEELRAKMRGGRIDAVNLPDALQVGAKKFP